MTDYSDYLAQQVQQLRIAHPDLCCRPNHRFTRMCMRDLGHRGKCPWEGEHDHTTAYTDQQDSNVKRRQSKSLDLHQLWTQPTLPIPYPDILPVFTTTVYRSGGIARSD